MDEHEDTQNPIAPQNDTLEEVAVQEATEHLPTPLNVEYALALPRFGRFELTTRIGTSTNGDEIYLCREDGTSPEDEPRFIRLRVGKASEDPEALERFQKDHFVGSSVNHRSVVKSLELIRAPHGIAVASEYASRGSLAGHLQSNPSMSVDEITRIFLSTCEGIAALHNEGIVHTQMSPGHIFFFKNGDIKVGDFSCALLQDPKLAVKSGTQIESSLYSPPEYLELGITSGAMDIYALGLILHEMISGQYPFQASNMVDRVAAQMEAKLPDIFRLRPDCPRVIQEVIALATRRDPAERYSSVDELIIHLSEGISPVARVMMAGKSLVQKVKSSISKVPSSSLSGYAKQIPKSYVSSSDNRVYLHRGTSRMGAAKR